MTHPARALLLGLLFCIGTISPVWAAKPPTPPAASQSLDRQVLILLRLPPEHFEANAAYGGGYGSGAGRAARQRIARRIAKTHGLTLVQAWPMPLLGLDCFVMSAPEGRTLEVVTAALSHDRDVAWSEPMHTYRAQAAAPGSQPSPPNDPLFRVQPVAAQWRLAELRSVATGRGVKVAVIDSSIDSQHPDLKGQVSVRQNFVSDHADVPELHGTGVAGIIAAISDNHLGIAGIAPDARLMALRACWQLNGASTLCDTLSLAKALHYALQNGAQVINLSLSGPPDQLLGQLIDVGLRQGVVVVGAVDPGLPGGGFPASHPGVVAVASGRTTSDGPNRIYVAPGLDVPTTLTGARWGLVNGSSYAAAHVSGLYALMLEREPRGRSLPMLIALSGGGAIDACASIRRGAPPCEGCACKPPLRYSADARR